MTDSAPFTIFYDGKCPLCVHEMRKLMALNTKGQLKFVDIHFLEQYPQFSQIPFEQANRILHGVTANGTLLLGLDVTYEAWRSVGRQLWVTPLKWRWVRFFADPIYLWFARNRFTISRWITGQARCEDQCSWPSKKN